MKAKYTGTCRHCHKPIHPGDDIAWRGRGRTYHAACAPGRPVPRTIQWNENEPLGLTLSRFDQFGIYASDGRKMGSTCQCEDYPCCGH